jgi:hypothetical protein
MAAPLAAHLSFAVLPLIAIAIITTVVAALTVGPRVARWLGAADSVGALAVFGFGFVLTWTLLPDADALEGIASDGVCDTSRLGLIPLRQLTALNDASLNVALFIPLGVAVGLLPRTRHAAAIVAAALSLTFVVEGIQLIVTALGRGCQTADLFDNLLGLTIGVVIGLLLRSLWPARRDARV